MLTSSLMNRSLSLQAKQILTVLLTALTAVGSGTTIRSYYEPNSGHAGPLLMLGVGIVGQVLLVFIQTKEERELETLREMRDEPLRNQLAIDRAVSDRIIQEIAAGHLDDAVEWNAFGEKLK